MTTKPLAPPEPSRAAVSFILVTVALDMMALGIIIPVFPKLVESFAVGDTAHAARIFGVFGTAWALMQFMFQPLLGMASDRFGRRPVVLLSNLGLGLDYILMALAPNLALLFIGRIISGICASSFSIATAYIADVTPPRNALPPSARSARPSGSALCWDLRSAVSLALPTRVCRFGSRPVLV